MKKLSVVLLAILLTISFFVSCDNNAKVLTDERVTVNFSIGLNGRSLGYEIEDVANLKWHFSASKTNQSDPFKFGETEDTPLESLGTEVELSQGKWNFTLWANRVDEGIEGTRVYEGSVTGVLITKENSPRSIVISVSPDVGNIAGSIEFNAVEIDLKDSDDTATVYAKTAVIEGVEGTIILTDGTAVKTDLTPGDYVVTVQYSETIDETTVVYASETIVVTVWSGRTTTISGNVSEETGSAIIDGDVQVPTVATVTKAATSGQTTVFTANVAPANNAESSRMDSTTVAFEADALTADTTYSLSVEVSNEVENGNINVGSSSGNAATLNLTLSDGTGTVSEFNGKTVTITTYIAKGLTGVNVTGPTGATITDVNYNPGTGELTFTTNHFSEYVVTATGSYEAYNATSKIAYTSFIEAINSLDENDVLYVIDEVVYDDTSALLSSSGPVISKPCTIYGNGHTVSVSSEVTTPSKNSRLLSIFDVTSGTVEIKNIKFISETYNTGFRGISLSGTHNMSIKLENVTIDIPHYYAFYIFNDCQNTEIVMDNCRIAGWATIYNQTSNVTLRAKDSSFDSFNPELSGGDTNSFGNIIVAEYYEYNSDGPSGYNDFTFEDCTFSAGKNEGADVNQVVFDVRSPNHNRLTITNCTMENLATPNYIKVAVDYVYPDDTTWEQRREMALSSRVIMDGKDITETANYIEYYIDFSEINDFATTYTFNPIKYFSNDMTLSDTETTMIVHNSDDDKDYMMVATKSEETGYWTLTCNEYGWKEQLLADYASLTDENSTITLSGEYVLDKDLVLEWPNESVKSITINGGEGLSITGEGKLRFKYPESDPNGDNLTITLGGTAWAYFSNIVIG